MNCYDSVCKEENLETNIDSLNENFRKINNRRIKTLKPTEVARILNFSIKAISLLLGKEDEKLLYGQFLDSFYAMQGKDLQGALISVEPIYNKNYTVFMCILAGTVEKLANDYELTVPSWVYKKEYYLDSEYYAFNTKNTEFQEYLKSTTPEEYKKRNLYVGDTMLERC